MSPKGAPVITWIITLAAFIGLFSAARFYMRLQMTCLWWCKLTLVAFVYFLHCAFSNVPSNCLRKRTYIHTGCIGLFFLQCVFSNVPSNRLTERTYIHTGCISLICLHCEFSNVSSKCLSKRTYSHIGCICMDFLPAFLYYPGCICSPFQRNLTPSSQ